MSYSNSLGFTPLFTPTVEQPPVQTKVTKLSWLQSLSMPRGAEPLGPLTITETPTIANDAPRREAATPLPPRGAQEGAQNYYARVEQQCTRAWSLPCHKAYSDANREARGDVAPPPEEGPPPCPPGNILTEDGFCLSTISNGARLPPPPPPPPLPVQRQIPWGWVAAGGAGLVALYLLFRRRKPVAANRRRQRRRRRR